MTIASRIQQTAITLLLTVSQCAAMPLAAAQQVDQDSFGETTSEAIDGGNPYYVPEAEPVAPRAAPPARPAVIRPAAPVEAPPGAPPGLPPRAGGPGVQKGGEF